MAVFRYPAIRTRQTSADKRIVTFSARASEIGMWSGVPQKKRFGETAETTGFQREEHPKRIEEIGAFCASEQNVIQNPLLCSTRSAESSSVEFTPNADYQGQDVEVGELVVEIQDFDTLELVDCLAQVRTSIEQRLTEIPDSVPRIGELKALAQRAGHFDAEHDTEGAETEDDGESASFESALFEESHLLDFWEEIAGRHELLIDLGEAFDGDEFLGFTAQSLKSFLKPVVLVDGQHRLQGAIRAAESALTRDEHKTEIEERVANGENPDLVHEEMITKAARILPVSLLMSNDPEEQVFQFVVVNQKATPIGKALLGTIVATTLSNEEMEKVAERLSAAGIDVEESKAITYLARHPESPFSGLVERGLAGDSKDLLQWNVLGSLIHIFRFLEGGVLFGQKIDFADKWRRNLLDRSQIAADYADSGHGSAFEYWSSLEGPWRSVFIAFFTEIMRRFSNSDDADKPNYWGRTRSSNLFNKISLTILASDFFQFLSETKRPIESARLISELVDEWLEDVNLGYFDKDWDLKGIKKDSSGIRNRWAELWSDYRRDPQQLPNRTNFRSAKKD